MRPDVEAVPRYHWRMANRDQWMKVIPRFMTPDGTDQYYLVAPTSSGTTSVELHGDFFRADAIVLGGRVGTSSNPHGITLETGNPDFLIIRQDNPPGPMPPSGIPQPNTTVRRFIPWSMVTDIVVNQFYRTPLLTAKAKSKKIPRKKV